MERKKYETMMCLGVTPEALLSSTCKHGKEGWRAVGMLPGLIKGPDGGMHLACLLERECAILETVPTDFNLS